MGIGAGTAGSSPAIIASTMAQHVMLVARGPIESSVVDSGTTPSRGIRDCVGLKPAMPQNAAGMPHRPAGIRADTHHRLAVGYRHRRPGGGAARDQAAVIRIAGCAVVGVDSDPGEGE